MGAIMTFLLGTGMYVIAAHIKSLHWLVVSIMHMVDFHRISPNEHYVTSTTTQNTYLHTTTVSDKKMRLHVFL